VTYDNKLLAKTGRAQRASDFLRALEK
jgi:hypothetical protein